MSHVRLNIESQFASTLSLAVIVVPAFWAMQYVDIRKNLLWVSTVSIVLFVACDFLSFQIIIISVFHSFPLRIALKPPSSSSTRKKNNSAQHSEEKKNVVLFCWLCSEGETRAGRERDWNLIEEKEPEENETEEKFAVWIVNERPDCDDDDVSLLAPSSSFFSLKFSLLFFRVLCANKNTHNFCALLRGRPQWDTLSSSWATAQHRGEVNLYFYVSLFRTPTQSSVRRWWIPIFSISQFGDCCWFGRRDDDEFSTAEWTTHKKVVILSGNFIFLRVWAAVVWLIHNLLPRRRKVSRRGAS